jgi:prepilin-type N-terminal cleavage/methylation domain-containing protein/prepilin-type processing-associated H-X9-DG protein
VLTGNAVTAFAARRARLVASARNAHRLSETQLSAEVHSMCDRTRAPSRAAPAPPRGFTLVELLVVVGIIAVLIGMLLPALAGVRAQSRAVACLSNIRQIATAAMMYAQEQKYYVTFVPAVGARPAQDRKELLYPYLLQGQNNADVAGDQVWTCPSNERVEQEASYGFNTNLNGQRLSRIRKWSETVALCDAGLADQPVPGTPSLATHCWPPARASTSASCRPNDRRHSNRLVGVGFVDGHGERLPMSPPFYPGSIGAYTPNGIADPNDPNYSDVLWDLQ